MNQRSTTPDSENAGFVLVGGASSRMGRDKALLPDGELVLVERIAREVEAAAGSVTLVGPPERYRQLGLEIIPDLRPGHGPLSGMEAALRHTSAAWNVIVACDMPGVTASFVGTLLSRAARNKEADCFVPLSRPGCPEPLCAVYHRRCLAAVSAAIEENSNKLMDLLGRVRTEYWLNAEGSQFDNVNTPEDWSRHIGAARGPRQVR